MARYNKKRARALKQDVFRDRTMLLVEKVADLLEGRGKAILYGLGGLIVLAVVVGLFVSWRGKKNQEIAQAMGRAIDISQTPITTTPPPNPTGPVFTDERDRAQRSIDEFQKVANKYGGQTKQMADYFIAANLLTLDRPKAEVQLEALSKSRDTDVASRSKFALAVAYEVDGKFDQSVALYKELAQTNSDTIPAEVANLRLALVEEKQGKKQEAVDLLFNLAKSSRTAQDKSGKPITQSSAARDAEKELEKLDPSRFGQLPPVPTSTGFPN